MKSLVNTIISLYLFVPTLLAQEIIQDSLKTSDLSEVTIVGDRGKTLPGAGQYIGLKNIEKLNQPNINNVLRTIPGINIRDEEGFGLRPNIGLRGTPVNRSAKITIMEDGVLIAPAPYADPSAYYFPTFARMQGVEVLKGSSQIKYGPYTIGGAVNLLSTSIPTAFKGFAQLSYGSFNTNQQRIWVGNSQKNIDYVLEINRLASTGFKQLDNGGNTGFERRDLMGKLRWHNHKNATIPQSITLKLVNTTEEGNETYLGLTFDDYQKNHLQRYAGTQKDRLDMDHQHISLNHAIKPTSGLTINTTAYYAKTFRDWARANTFGGQSITNALNNTTAAQQLAYNIMTGQANGNIEYQSAARTYNSKGIQWNANYMFTTQEIRHKLQIGARIHEDEADRYATRSIYSIANGVMALSSEGIKGNQENQIRSANSFATFLSYDIQYKSFKLSPGIRFEKINFNFQNFGTADNPRAGSALKTATNEITIALPGIGFNHEFNNIMSAFGGVHKGFSPPGMPSVTTTDRQAKAETSMNYELGYRYETPSINWQVSGFLNNYENILGSDNVSGGGAGSGDMFNAGNAIIKGLELSISIDLLGNKHKSSEIKLPFALAYTYTSAKFQETFINGGGDWGTGTIQKGDIIPFITPQLFTASIGYEGKKFEATLVGRFTGETRVKPGQDDSIIPAQNVSLASINSLESFLIFDLSANYKINRTFTAFGLVNNLTNNKAIVANLPQSYRPNMPISLNAGVKLHF